MRVSAHPQMNMAALTFSVQPKDGELVAARRHRGTARIRLAKTFDISRIVPLGSHARGTAVRTYSDLDMLVVLRRNEAKWGGSLVSSHAVLNRIREDLEERYASTSIRRDQQAAVVEFSQGQQSLDVVPAIFSRWEKQRPVFSIPDGQGQWMETSPEAHDRFFSTANERSGGKLRRVAQLVKWWKFSRSQTLPLQSFYIDILLATTNICDGVKPYTHCLYQAFKLLKDRECRGLRDPLGFSGVIYIAQTELQGEAIYDSVEYSFDHATRALAAETVRDLEEANRQWSIVFNDTY